MMFDIERWKYKLVITGIAMLIYGVGMVNVDASVSCLGRMITSMTVYPNGTRTITPCVTQSIIGLSDPIDSYHEGMIMMGMAAAVIMVSVLWI